MIIYISESTRPDKKWMAKAEGHRTVHFGQRGASDYTLHHDDARRQAYIARHGSREDWGRTGVMTPGWLSRHLLWEKRSLPAAIAAASHMHEGGRFRLARFFAGPDFLYEINF
jgi:hypothetical protein